MQVQKFFFHFRCRKKSDLIGGLHFDCFATQFIFKMRSFSTSPNPQAGRPNIVGLSANAYSIYLYLLTILHAVPPFAT
jgi:hypothetical protein